MFIFHRAEAATSFLKRVGAVNLSKPKKNFKTYLSVFLPTTLSIAVFFGVTHRQHTASNLKSILAKNAQELIAHKKLIANDLNMAISDLTIVANQRVLKDFVNLAHPSPQLLREEYLNIVQHQTLYDQVQFMDETGREIVRADFYRGHAQLIPEKELQSKASQYWFKDTIARRQNELFISQLELNVENDRIEEPFKPTIRLGTPVFDSEGKKQGIVVLNYRADKLISRLDRQSVYSPGSMMLLNKEGFWLKSNHPQDEWGFMLSERKNRKFENTFPAAWKQIRERDSGTFSTSEGTFSFTTIYPILEAYQSNNNLYWSLFQEQHKIDTKKLEWKLVYLLTPSESAAISRQLLKELLPLYCGVLFLNSLGCALLTVVRVRRQLTDEELCQMQLKLQEFAKREELMKSRLASQIRDSLELNIILETVVRESRELLQIDRCVLGWYRGETEPPIWEVIAEAKLANLPSLLNCPPTESVQPLIDRLQETKSIEINDLQTCDDSHWQNLLESWGYRAAIALGIRTRGGQWGILVCGDCWQPREWTTLEVETIAGIGEQLAIALNQAELYAQSQANAQAAESHARQLQETLQDLKQTQVQLIQSEKMSSLGQLVAGVAHDINNPVNFIHGNLTHANEYTQDILNLLQLYQKYYPHPHDKIQKEIEAIDLEFVGEDLPKIIQSMQSGTERIRNIVKSLRSFSRLDEAELKSVNLHEGIANTFTILHHRLKAQSDRPAIEVIQEYQPLPLVECYAGQLNQVLLNLIGNAIDAVEESFVSRNLSLEKFAKSPEIRISTKALSNGWIAISIRDNGQGIPENLRSRLFDPFFTTKPVGKGTGLGLSISYQIVVKQHGGTLECSSILGQGTEFTIQIPQKQQQRLPVLQGLDSNFTTPFIS